MKAGKAQCPGKQEPSAVELRGEEGGGQKGPLDLGRSKANIM